MIEPRYLWGLSNNVDIVTLEMVKGIGLGELETIEREQNLDCFSSRFIEAVRAFRPVIRCWWVHLFVMISLK